MTDPVALARTRIAAVKALPADARSPVVNDLLTLVAVERECAEHAQEILGRIAAVVAATGALFMDADWQDDWDAAIAWMETHLGMEPEASARECYVEAISEWRALAREKARQLDEMSERAALAEQRVREVEAEAAFLRNEIVKWYDADNTPDFPGVEADFIWLAQRLKLGDHPIAAALAAALNAWCEDAEGNALNSAERALYEAWRGKSDE